MDPKQCLKQSKDTRSNGNPDQAPLSTGASPEAAVDNAFGVMRDRGLGCVFRLKGGPYFPSPLCKGIGSWARQV